MTTYNNKIVFTFSCQLLSGFNAERLLSPQDFNANPDSVRHLISQFFLDEAQVAR